MRLNLISLACAALLAAGLSFGVGAGPIVDSDSDGIIDELDNCSNIANVDQFDADVDGYGSICDGDFDDDFIVFGTDYSSLAAAFGSNSPPAAKELDMDNDGLIFGTDFSAFAQQFGGPPGPSGLDCAGNVGACAGISPP